MKILTTKKTQRYDIIVKANYSKCTYHMYSKGGALTWKYQG